MRENKKRNRMTYLILALIILVPILILLCFTDNKHIDFSSYDINYKNDATQIKILHLSDMHFPKCEVDLDLILNKIEEDSIDIIAITGDLIDSSAEVLSCGVIPFLVKLNKYSNIYYVCGNHEIRHKEYLILKEHLENNNIKVLENSFEEIDIKGQRISIMGLVDGQDYSTNYFEGLDSDTYKVLLAHRPEKFDNYTSASSEYNPDLILSGHAHGGQVRIGKLALVAPNQGLNPKFTSGIYSSDNGNINMVVSRGIGNSVLPLRINDKPHIPIISIYLQIF